MRTIAFVLAALCFTPAWAQPADGPYARMVVIVPKPGQGAHFENGYERHLQWHRSVKDPWT